MPAEFEKLRGYSILDYIPILCGQIMDSPDISEAVLFDFRQTIADLIENNYYRHYSNLLHKDKMEFHAEVIYGNANYPPLDILKSTECVDLPMYEFWTSTDNQNMIQYHPQNGYELNMPACAAIGYNKPVMASEAYTGFAHYSESPQNLKPFGDRAFCAGINCMVLHSNVHQPTDKLPGMTLGNFASHFNRNNLYYQFISEWFRYQSRIQYVLQSGPTVPDVLCYLGDQLPQYWVYNQTNTMPFGYYATACNFDILQNKTEVVDGKIRFNKLFDYSLLTLPPFTVINYETLKRIDQLVSNGAVLYGPKPVKTLSLSDVSTNKNAFEQLANKIWGNIDGKTITENSYGKGKVFWGMSMAEVLKKIDLGPDVSTSLPDSLNFMFIHKKINNDDVYFIANQQNTTLIREFTFRTGEKTPEIWNPLSGEVIEQGIYAYKDGYIKIPVTFKPYESCIFVFRNGKPRLHIESVSCNGKQIFPAENGDASVSIPNALLKGNSISIISDETADYSFGLSNKKVVNQKIEKPDVLAINNFKGKMIFNPAWKTEIDPVEITELKPLSENENPAIKYFAGTVHYSIPFEISNDKVLKADSILLDLGNFEADAQVILNGKLIGNAWLPGALISVKNILKKSNSLDVTIATTFRNRFIGDFVEFGAPKNIWSSATVSEFLNKNSVLKPSGLLGPIQIIAIKMSRIN
jgi:hypothetical protein